MAPPHVFVVALLGEAGSGKSTVARFLERTYGFTRLSLATPLKEITRRAFELTHEQVYGDLRAKEAVDPRYNVSPRWLLQRLGTEGMRAVLGEDFFLDHLFKTIFMNGDGNYVIEDLRFPNEAQRLHEIKRYAMYYTSFGPDEVHHAIFKLEGGLTGEATLQAHASETGAAQIPAEWIYDTIRAPVSPGAQALLACFEASFGKFLRDQLPDETIARVGDA